MHEGATDASPVLAEYTDSTVPAPFVVSSPFVLVSFTRAAASLSKFAFAYDHTHSPDGLSLLSPFAAQVQADTIVLGCASPATLPYLSAELDPVAVSGISGPQRCRLYIRPAQQVDPIGVVMSPSLPWNNVRSYNALVYMLLSGSRECLVV